MALFARLHANRNGESDVLGPAIVDACGRLLPAWRRLMEKYPDRFMFATDAHENCRWEKYADIVDTWRLILGQLPNTLAENLAWRNAERVYQVRG